MHATGRCFLVIATIAATMVACQPGGPTEADLYGVWHGEHEGYRVTFTFRNDKTCELHFENAEKGELTVWTGNFETDFTKKPVAMSIRNIQALAHPLHTIVRFETRDQLTMAAFAPRWRLRPVSFIPERSMSLARLAAQS